MSWRAISANRVAYCSGVPDRDGPMIDVRTSEKLVLPVWDFGGGLVDRLFDGVSDGWIDVCGDEGGIDDGDAAAELRGVSPPAKK